MNGPKCKDCRLQERELVKTSMWIELKSGVGTTLKCEVLDECSICEVENFVVKPSGEIATSKTSYKVKNPTSDQLSHVQSCRKNLQSIPSWVQVLTRSA